MRRRLKFTSVVLVNQMLLIALAIAWLIHMIVIAFYGAVHFVEMNPPVSLDRNQRFITYNSLRYIRTDRADKKAGRKTKKRLGRPLND